MSSKRNPPSEACKDGNRKRMAKIRAQFSFKHDGCPSQRLFDEVRAAASVNVFLQSPEKIVQWAARRDTKVRDEIILFGMAAIIKLLRRSPNSASRASLFKEVARSGRLRAEISANDRARSAQFSRIVEMLDGHQVDGKTLGDCTKGDLLRAAATAETAAGQSVMHAQVYRLLAAMLPDRTVTVRQAHNRKEIVGLLTATFKEAA